MHLTKLREDFCIASSDEDFVCASGREGFSLPVMERSSGLVWEKRAADAPSPRQSYHFPLEESAFELFQGGES